MNNSSSSNTPDHPNSPNTPNTPSRLTAWDRDYIEHLIRRDWEAISRHQAEQESHAHNLFMGGDRYYWDIHSWPTPRGVQGHHEVVVIKCPACGERLDLSLVPSPWPPSGGNHVHHAPGCEFFRTEQRQWVDDYADLRNDCQQGTKHHGYSRAPILRPLIESEKALLDILTQGQSHLSCYMVSVSIWDYQLIRQIIEVPDFS